MSKDILSQRSLAGAKSLFTTPLLATNRIEPRMRIEGEWLSVFEVGVAPGGRTPLHRHASPEVFRILEGRLTIWRETEYGREQIEAQAGDIVRIEANQPHRYANTGAERAVFRALVDSDMAAFYARVGLLGAQKGAPQPEAAARIEAVADAHGITILAA